MKLQVLTKNEAGLKALVLSDLHIFQDKDIRVIEKLMDKLKNNNYDAIYLVGDIIDATNALRNEDVYKKLIDFITYLGVIAPTYIVYGSHDLAYRTISKKNPWLSDEITFREMFLNKVGEGHNINVLENETKNIKDGYTVSGFNPSLNYAVSSPDGNTEVLLSDYSRYQFLERLDSNTFNTLLCHYPNAIMDLQKVGVLKDIDLSVAGHNHNGMTQILPLELFLNIVRQKNRGLITPGKSINLTDTKNLRGVIRLDDRNTLLINPAMKTLAACTGALEKMDFLFYRGFSEIEYIPEGPKLNRKK